MNTFRKNYKEFIKNNKLILKYRKDLEARNIIYIIYLLKSITRLHQVITMITEYNQFI